MYVSSKQSDDKILIILILTRPCLLRTLIPPTLHLQETTGHPLKALRKDRGKVEREKSYCLQKKIHRELNQ